MGSVSRKKFAATRLTPAQAHEVWADSDEASAFTRPEYLAQLVDEVEWWGVERSGHVVAAWPLVRACAGGEIGPPPFCYYVGPMFARSLREALYHRYWSVHTTVFSTLVGALTAEYRRFRFSLPIGLSDVRPMEWWSHDNPGSPGFRLTPRYTARIDLAEFPDAAALQRSLARIKRRDIKRWSATPPAVVDRVSEQCVLDLHDRALLRGGSEIDEHRHNALRRMIRLIGSGAGSMVGFSPENSDQIEAVILTLDGSRDSNDVLCVASNYGREHGLTAWATWHGMLRAQSMGKRWFDFNGANSPGRAADKHYYGARTAMYFNGSFG